MLRASLLALASALLFGASTPASKALLGAFAPFQLAGLLYLGAALGVAPRVLTERGRTSRIDPVSRRRLFGAVVFGGTVGPVLLLFALQAAPAASVSLYLNLETAATAALGVALFRDHLGRRGWAGVAGIVGAGALLSSTSGSPGLRAGALAAAACLCWGLDNQLTSLLVGMSPARCTFWKGIVAGTVNLGLGACLDPLRAGPADLGAALGIGALSYGASIALYIAAARELGATRAQGIFASAPFLGAALSFALLGEPFGAAQTTALALLVPAVALLQLDRHAHRHSHVAIEHEHEHRHDDGHHLHEHAGFPPSALHSHPHRHEPLSHAHPHAPDLHHRHVHQEPPANPPSDRAIAADPPPLAPARS